MGLRLNILYRKAKKKYDLSEKFFKGVGGGGQVIFHYEKVFLLFIYKMQACFEQVLRYEIIKRGLSRKFFMKILFSWFPVDLRITQTLYV